MKLNDLKQQGAQAPKKYTQTPEEKAPDYYNSDFMKSKRDEHFFRISNPQKKGLTIEQIAQDLASRYNVNYFVLSLEQGIEEPRTLHIHGYVLLNSRISRASIDKHIFKEIHAHFIDPIQGTPEEIRAYILKDEEALRKKGELHKLAEKIDGAQFEYGTVPKFHARGQGKRNDLNNAFNMLYQGKSKFEIYSKDPSVARYYGAINAMEKEIERVKYGENSRDMMCVWIQGETGTGKTEAIYREYGIKNIFPIDNYDNDRFIYNGYNKQKILLYDDFNSSVKLNQLIRILNGKPFCVNVKGGELYLQADKVFFTSNYELKDQFPNIKEENQNQWQALMRRINYVVKYTGFLQYEVYERRGVFENGKNTFKFDFVNVENNSLYMEPNKKYIEIGEQPEGIPCIKYIEYIDEEPATEQAPENIDLFNFENLEDMENAKRNNFFF